MNIVVNMKENIVTKLAFFKPDGMILPDARNYAKGLIKNRGDIKEIFYIDLRNEKEAQTFLETHYAHHKDEPFFEPVILNYMLWRRNAQEAFEMGRILNSKLRDLKTEPYKYILEAMLLEGTEGDMSLLREQDLGATRIEKARLQPTSIRGMYGTKYHNLKTDFEGNIMHLTANEDDGKTEYDRACKLKIRSL